MRFAVRRLLPATGLLGAFGLLTGPAVAPTVACVAFMHCAGINALLAIRRRARLEGA